MSQKYVYLFKEGNANMRELLGGKGANLAEMTNLGLPIHKVLQLQQKLAQNIMKMVKQFHKKFKTKFLQL